MLSETKIRETLKMTKKKKFDIQDCYDSCSADEAEMKERRGRGPNLNGRVSREHTKQRVKRNAKRWQAAKGPNTTDA